MTPDHLVTILTIGAVPVFLGLLTFAQFQMKRNDARRDAEEAQDAKEKELAKKVLARYTGLREQYSDLRNRAIRRLQAALDRVDSQRYPEAAKVLESAIVEFEKIELPPVE